MAKMYKNHTFSLKETLDLPKGLGPRYDMPSVHKQTTCIVRSSYASVLK